ncbi:MULTISPECIES: type I restriction endonuclease [unclassified Bradyrhizobium]|uniref:type I restriction endonuclease n=1 Tax=unclassified Bradyrhizobium TaxID=2631580 RepID=UPI001FFADEFB
MHEERKISSGDASGAVKELFHVCFWFARTYAKVKPADRLTFDPSVLSRRDEVLKKAFVQLKTQQAELDAKNGELTKLLLDKQNLDEELKTIRAEVAAARKAAQAKPDSHDYNEAETRDRFIDLLLREAGWALDQPDDTEFRVEGMPNNQAIGFVDYVLWGADGKPLGLVEAKRTRKDARAGQQQAKLYADCLQARYGQRPVIFYSNGYEHWIWDDTR